jgi:GTP-binding protein
MIRNIAIIAHVDHGKTSLVNEMLKQGKVFRANQEVADRVMDSNDLERERGITILAKNTSCFYTPKGGKFAGQEFKINIIDTPGHADFGGEVERVLKMADGVLLLVDAYEGPMPQTRFVLQKALDLNLKVVIVINKVDRADARLNEVGDEVLELLMDLGADNDALDSPIVYASARAGTASVSPNMQDENLDALFETIISYIPEPKMDKDGAFQMLVSANEHSEYLGKMAIGKVGRGSVRVNQQIAVADYNSGEVFKTKITGLFEFAGMKKNPVEVATAGDIIVVATNEPATIGKTLCDPAAVEPLEFVKISEPSVEMTFSVNDSPFAGKEGKFVTSRHLRTRLYKEADKDLSLRVRDGETTESFFVAGRGEMHLSILIENMRREGFEFQVSNPRVLYKEIDGKTHEPVDKLLIDVPEVSVGAIMSAMGIRKGELKQMSPIGSRVRLEILIPSRGLFGYKSEMLTDTKGEGVMSSVFDSYQPFKGNIQRRVKGSLIAFESGTANAYGLHAAQERGELFISAGEEVYGGMVVGENPKSDDLPVNVCKTKHLTNMRSSSADEALTLTPPRKMSLENALEFLADDELLEVTPKHIRIRKQILDHNVRLRARARS